MDYLIPSERTDVVTVRAAFCSGSTKQVFATAALLDRCEAVGGDFFQIIPGGGDSEAATISRFQLLRP